MNLYMTIGREGGLTGILYMQALDALDAFSLVEIVTNEESGKLELVMHTLVQEILQALLLSRESYVRDQAARVIDFFLAKVREWEASVAFPGIIWPGMIESVFVESWAQRVEDGEAAEKPSINEQYDRFKHIRYVANFTKAIIYKIAKVHKYHFEHPGKRFGSVIFRYRGPDLGLEQIAVIPVAEENASDD